MDALGIQSGTVVADIGSGDGYFSFHLARRVGAGGRVYAVDIDKGALDKLRKQAEKEKLSQIETIVSAKDDPRLPPESVDVVLVVNAYHEMRDYDAMLAGLFRTLKPGGLLGIIEAEDEPGKPRETYYNRHRLPEEIVRQDAERAGFRFLRKERGFTRPNQQKEFYFLIFEKPGG
ncbi:MAG: class I SAM-dependent methyltransferase [Acidobacteria bacterium]|nr:class I SAM-dependent methyltransferase [Acidobacteriota bacterium]